MDLKLNKKIALVTGSSSGIGLGIAKKTRKTSNIFEGRCY